MMSEVRRVKVPVGQVSEILLVLPLRHFPMAVKYETVGRVFRKRP